MAQSRPREMSPQESTGVLITWLEIAEAEFNNRLDTWQPGVNIHAVTASIEQIKHILTHYITDIKLTFDVSGSYMRMDRPCNARNLSVDRPALPPSRSESSDEDGHIAPSRFKKKRLHRPPASKQSKDGPLVSSVLSLFITSDLWKYYGAFMLHTCLALLKMPGADANMPGEADNLTALHYAVLHNRSGLIPSIIQAGVDINHCGGFDHVTALHMAIWKGYQEAALELLVNHKGDLNPHSLIDYVHKTRPTWKGIRSILQTTVEQVWPAYCQLVQDAVAVFLPVVLRDTVVAYVLVV